MANEQTSIPMQQTQAAIAVRARDIIIAQQKEARKALKVAQVKELQPYHKAINDALNGERKTSRAQAIAAATKAADEAAAEATRGDA